MIKFKDITVQDKDVIQRFTLYGERQNCDLSIANLISWRFLYNTQFAIVKNHLVVRFYVNNHLAYMLPLPQPTLNANGKWCVEPCKECSAEVIQLMKEDANAMGYPLKIMGVCNYMADILEKTFPNVFEIKADRDVADYIYTREKLVLLSGKKLHGKRNHINKFKSLYPNYAYKPLTKEFIPQCLLLAKQWIEAYQAEGADTNQLTAELRSMTRAFEFWDDLSLIGGTLWVENHLVAFSYGCAINQNTFDVCVEKADVNYEGSFTMINNLFAKHLPEQFYYINREEDLGEEGLRRAKLSYHPDILLEKNTVMEAHVLPSSPNAEEIKKQTKRLWQEVFNDKEAFVQLYFSKVFTPENNYTICIDNKVVGALQALPYTLKIGNEKVEGVYISGICTAPNKRKLNIGNNIMHQAHFNSFHKGAVFSFLIPAEDWLIDWYSKCGYVKNISCELPPVGFERMTFNEFNAWQQAQKSIVLHTEEQFAIALEDVRIDGSDYNANDKVAQGMIRLLNVYEALKIFAKLCPSFTMVLQVKGDKDIPFNNAYYVIDKGKVFRTHEPFEQAKVMNVAQVAELILRDMPLYMTLMLN